MLLVVSGGGRRPVPPGWMPPVRGGRPLKRWRYVGGYGDDVCLCLVSGVHDVGMVTERAVWRGGVPVPAGAMSMSDELDRVTTVDGGDLRFHAEAVRRRDDRVLGGLVRSEYVQPFGTFAGTLPGQLELASGFGVLERHRARW